MIQTLLENFKPENFIGWLFLLAGLIAAVTGLLAYPAIKNVAEAKNLMDNPDARSSHHTKVPNLGGVGIYLSIVVAITMLGAVLDTKSLFLILGGITILFFLGLKDDILVLSPRKKFIGQLLAAFLLIVFTDTRILGFSGLFGVTLLPYAVSVLFTLFVYLLIINAFNLIDGIDGLAGTLALMASAGFAFLFCEYKDVSMVALSGAVFGALIPFLYLNFSKQKKMFLGDTGSMILGFILAVMAVRFINASQVASASASEFKNAAPILALAVLFFPLLDTLRIFIIRIVVHKKSPFIADKNHIHHRFLELGFSHKRTTFTVVLLNVLLIAVAYTARNLDIHWQMLVLIACGGFLYMLPFVGMLLKRHVQGVFETLQ